MWRYIELLSFEPISVVRQWQQDVGQGRNPRDIKVMFAQEIVSRFYSRREAETALADFEARFRRGGLPDDMLEKILYTSIEGEGLPIAQLLKQAGLTASTTEALRMIEQGGVKLNGEKVSDKTIKLGRGETAVVQVGKRKFARVTISSEQE
jgi:tyrosyl-tRNA synthetase